ncbi:putative holin-like toxin [Eubacterium aggregans]
MTVYEGLMLMLTFGGFVVLLLWCCFYRFITTIIKGMKKATRHPD